MLIGIAGKAKSGKDTVGQFIRSLTRKPMEHISFAEPLKRGLLAMFEVYGITEEDCFGSSEMRNAQIGDMCFDDTNEPITIRHALQTLGTEWGRQQLYSNVWIDLGIARAQEYLCDDEDDPIVIITDVRFENEMKAIREAGGELWHVDRPDGGLEGKAGLHASERDLVPPLVKQGDPPGRFVLGELRTAHIINDGTLDDLRDKVKAALAAVERKTE